VADLLVVIISFHLNDRMLEIKIKKAVCTGPRCGMRSVDLSSDFIRFRDKQILVFHSRPLQP